MSETYKPEVPAHRPPAAPHGSAGHGGDAHAHTSTPYWIVWIALCGLTILTVMTGKQHLGTIALPLALAIATTKSLLVLFFFMHLNEQKGAPRLAIAMSVVFALVLMGFTLADVATRFAPLTPANAPFGAKVILPQADERRPHEAKFGEKQPKADPQFGR